MSSMGFSTPFLMIMSTLALLVLTPITWAAIHNAAVSSHHAQVKNKIKDLHINIAAQNEQCGGDGVDSNPWCDYEYVTSADVIKSALSAAGYSQSNSISFGNSTKVTYKEIDSPISFDVSADNGVVTLYGEWSQ